MHDSRMFGRIYWTFTNRQRCILLGTVLFSVVLATSVLAQEPPNSSPGSTECEHSEASESEENGAPRASRLFGVLPNASTVEPGMLHAPLTTRDMFRFATVDSFDRAVYPFVAGVAYLGIGQSAEPYWRRYATTFADNAVGNYMVGAIVPLALGQDPRYFVRGQGNIFARFGYAASRAVITRSRAGGTAFNASELGGSLAAATLGSLYYPAADRTPRSIMARASSQVLWDTLAFESKEFWPDIFRTFKEVFHRP